MVRQTVSEQNYSAWYSSEPSVWSAVSWIFNLDSIAGIKFSGLTRPIADLQRDRAPVTPPQDHKNQTNAKTVASL